MTTLILIYTEINGYFVVCTDCASPSRTHSSRLKTKPTPKTSFVSYLAGLLQKQAVQRCQNLLESQRPTRTTTRHKLKTTARIKTRSI